MVCVFMLLIVRMERCPSESSIKVLNTKEEVSWARLSVNCKVEKKVLTFVETRRILTVLSV